MSPNEWIGILGLTSEDMAVKKALAHFLITKAPKLQKGLTEAYAVNEKKGIDFTFEDERMIEFPIRKYEEGSLVLVNVRFYSEGVEGYRRFGGELPYGLNFSMSWKAVQVQLGKKPAEKGDEIAIMRWDFRDHCLFVQYGEKGQSIETVAIQTPVK